MTGLGMLGALLGATVGGTTYATAAALRAPRGCQISIVAAAMQGALGLGALYGGICAVTPVLDYINHIRPEKQEDDRWWPLCVVPPMLYWSIRVGGRHPILYNVSTLLVIPLIGPGMAQLRRLAKCVANSPS
ncbi:hypothetical protein B0H11DRAFT_1940072 [Mycena galericulata]|nr:hypothetical protein B0H11DRAFT_1940072 [Mycena galericulata]